MMHITVTQMSDPPLFNECAGLHGRRVPFLFKSQQNIQYFKEKVRGDVNKRSDLDG